MAVITIHNCLGHKDKECRRYMAVITILFVNNGQITVVKWSSATEGYLGPEGDERRAVPGIGGVFY
jgi:hypothetical protein